MFGNEPRVRVVYKMSSGCGKNPPRNFSNKSCFLNCLSAFPDSDFYAVLDNANESCESIMKETDTPYEMSHLGNSGTYLRTLDIVSEKYSNSEWFLDDIVYFAENDYCHRLGSKDALLEGIHISDYVTLYDHPDKYDNNQTHFGMHYSDIKSKLYVGRSGYWRSTTSTCGTYGTTVRVLLEDIEIHRKFCAGAVMQDCAMFHNLVLSRQRSLVSPMPGFASHGEMLSPHVDWERILGAMTNA